MACTCSKELSPNCNVLTQSRQEDCSFPESRVNVPLTLLFNMCITSSSSKSNVIFSTCQVINNYLKNIYVHKKSHGRVSPFQHYKNMSLFITSSKILNTEGRWSIAKAICISFSSIYHNNKISFFLISELPQW